MCGGVVVAEILRFLDGQPMLVPLVHDHTLNDKKAGSSDCAHFTDEETG